jgi:hypothetical protein
VWTEVVRRDLSVALLAAVEAQVLARDESNYLVGGLGGLLVLLRTAGLDVVAAREGPRVVVRFDDDRGTMEEAFGVDHGRTAASMSEG